MKREDKIAFVQVKLIEGWRDKDIRLAIEVPRSTYFYWKSLIQQNKYAELVNRQKPGPKPRFTISPVNQRRITSWRRQYGWGPTKIEGHLGVHHSTHVPHNAIYDFIKDRGLNKPIGYERRTWGKKRWERQHSMSLWQGDWKDINSDTEIPMMSFYDDHSRYIVASQRFNEATMENTIRLVEQAFRKYGRPEQIITDNGSQFKNNQSENLTEFEKFCTGQGVEVIHSTKNRPTTMGKIENFHGCYDAEIWVTQGNHAKFVHYWNNKRPNGAIGYLYPVEVFYRDRKSPINSG
jgi:putative transposase